MKGLSAILILVSTLCMSCREEENVLPSITMEGKNTFGCLVNGELWLPEGRGGGALPLTVDRTGEFLLGIYASNHENHTGVALFIIDSTGLQANKVYNLTNEPTNHGEYRFRMGDQTCFYDHREGISGKMMITKLANQVVSGTFEFTSFNSDCGDTVKVTDGRFDIGTITY